MTVTPYEVVTTTELGNRMSREPPVCHEEPYARYDCPWQAFPSADKHGKWYIVGRSEVEETPERRGESRKWVKG